jgi:hypothetical protein
MNDSNREQLDTERLNELAFSFKKSQALVAALDVGLFSAIAAGKSDIAAIAEHLNSNTETIDRLVVVCRAMSLVTGQDGELRNLPDVERYLVRDKRGYIGDYLRFTASTEYKEWADFSTQLAQTSDEPPPSKLYQGDLNDPERARVFTESGYDASIALGYRLAKRFDFTPYRRWLDFAGGSGCYSIAVCERFAHLRATVMDHPNVIPVAQEFIDKHGLSERVDTAAGDFTKSGDYPTGYDLISFITPFHWYLEPVVVQALKDSYQHLEPGGSVLIIGYMLDDERSGPLDSAYYHLQALRGGHFTGHVPSGPQYLDYLDRAGFVTDGYEWFLPNRLGMIAGHKR